MAAEYHRQPILSIPDLSPLLSPARAIVRGQDLVHRRAVQVGVRKLRRGGAAGGKVLQRVVSLVDGVGRLGRATGRRGLGNQPVRRVV
jgi:hypothetical protein